MSSERRRLARAADRRFADSIGQRAPAVLLLDATGQQELAETLAAIELVHRRFCASCAQHKPLRVSIERLEQ